MTEIECSFTAGINWFRLKACGILINDNKVLVVENCRDPYYYPLGGGILHGESAKEAVIREVFEETGAHFEVDRLAFIHENFYIGNENSVLAGMKCHEISFYFLMKWNPDRLLKDSSETFDGFPEHLVWLEISKLKELGEPCFPTFFADELLKISDGVTHIVTFDEKFQSL